MNAALVRWLLVLGGSAVGGGLRYGLSGWVVQRWGPSFPVGTIGINALGSFCIMWVMRAHLHAQLLGEEGRLLLATGLLGGFTTYSSFNYETFALLENRGVGWAALNVGLTLVACLAAGAVGLLVGRWAFR